MRVKILQWDDDLAVRLTKEVVEALHISPGSEMELTVLEEKAELKPVISPRRAKFEALLAEMDRLGPDAIPPFEDWGILPSEWPPYDQEDDNAGSASPPSSR